MLTRAQVPPQRGARVGRTDSSLHGRERLEPTRRGTWPLRAGVRPLVAAAGLGAPRGLPELRRNGRCGADPRADGWRDRTFRTLVRTPQSRRPRMNTGLAGSVRSLASPSAPPLEPRIPHEHRGCGRLGPIFFLGTEDRSFACASGPLSGRTLARAPWGKRGLWALSFP